MAKRRSARLQSAQKGRMTSQSPAPSDEGTTSLNSEPIVAKLPPVDERNETLNVDSTLSKTAAPSPNVNSLSPFSPSVTIRTPTNKTPIRPSGEQMHPSQHQASTAKPLEEARWLGFMAKGARTAPPKTSSNPIAVAQATPTKAQPLAQNPFSTPEFKFKCKRPSLELSPEAQKLMAESREEAAKIRAQMVPASGLSGIEGDASKRKYAQPKGKAGRFSDVHMEHFKKMDSIANHPSAFRANLDRANPPSTSLKRKPSKAELEKPETPSHKNTPSTRQTQAKAQGCETPAKRRKRADNDDVSMSRTLAVEKKIGNTKPSTPKTPGTARPASGIPRLISTLYTPTKASLAKAQTTKCLKSIVPSMARSPCTPSLGATSRFLAKSTAEAGAPKISTLASKITNIKSILRTPQRLYSNDPGKIAAGTHIATPKELKFGYIGVPKTAPVIKHVNFTDSTVARAEIVERTMAATRSSSRASSEESDQITMVSYPTLPAVDQSPSRRPVLSEMPGSFTFRSDREIIFGPPAAGTIRHVRSSSVGAIAVETIGKDKKRKADSITETSDKENEHMEDNRPTKRQKAAEPSLLKTPNSKTPHQLPRRPRTISHARLNLLAMPKRRTG